VKARAAAPLPAGTWGGRGRDVGGSAGEGRRPVDDGDEGRAREGSTCEYGQAKRPSVSAPEHTRNADARPRLGRHLL